MKKIRLLLLACVLVACTAKAGWYYSVPVAAAGGVEGFEGTGAPTNWTAGGEGVNWDYSAAPIKGAQSAQMLDTATTREAIWDFPEAADEVWMAFIFQPSADPAANVDFVEILDGAGSTMAVLRETTTGTISSKVQASYTGIINDIPAGTSFRIKMRYVKGTGANETLEVWAVDDASVGWGTSASQTNGTDTGQAGQIKFRNPAATNHDQKIDNVLIKTSDIAIGELD